MNIRRPKCPVGFPYPKLPFGVTVAEVSINCLDLFFWDSSLKDDDFVTFEPEKP